MGVLFFFNFLNVNWISWFDIYVYKCMCMHVYVRMHIHIPHILDIRWSPCIVIYLYRSFIQKSVILELHHIHPSNMYKLYNIRYYFYITNKQTKYTDACTRARACVTCYYTSFTRRVHDMWFIQFFQLIWAWDKYLLYN